MKTLNEIFSGASDRIDRAFDLNQPDKSDAKQAPNGDLASRVGVQPPGPDGAGIMRSLDEVESKLDRFRFDRTQYDEAASRTKLNQLAQTLRDRGVPDHVVDAGLRQARADLGRHGVRHLFHWNAQKPVHTRRVERAFARMRALVAPVAAAQDRLKTISAIRGSTRQDIDKAETALAGLKERKVALESHESSFGLGKYGRQELARVNQEISELETTVAADRLVVDDADREIDELTTLIGKFGGADTDATSHFGRVQGGLDHLVVDAGFLKTYDKLNPGARRSRFWGYLGKKFAHPVKSGLKKLAAVVTLTGSSIVMGWHGAISSQDKARRFGTAQHQLPTPAARMMAAVLLDRFDAEAYKKGLGAAMATSHLPMAIHIPGVVSLASAPIPGLLGSAVATHVHGELAKEFAKDITREAFGEVKSEVVGPMQNQAVRLGSTRRDGGPFPMPTVPIAMDKGATVKHVDLSDKRTALALLIHLGPAVDQGKVGAGDQPEIARRDLRREIFHAADDEDFSAASRGKNRSPERKAFDKKLTNALYDPEHDNRDNILGQASPLHQMFAAAGLL